MQDANTISRKFTVLNQLVNPLQSRCSFSESDLQKLFPSRKKKRLSERDLHDYLQRINSTASKLSGTSGSESNEEQNVTLSISDIIKENNLSENITSKNQLSHLIYTVFIGIFYKAVKSHFVCPICNELLRKPKMLPACGHMFCSHCLAAWFTNSSLRSCPVCRKFSALNQAPVPNCTVRTFIEKTEKLRKYFKDQRGRRDDHQNHALLTILGLPPNETNQSLIAYLTPGYQSFESKSLQNIQRKWVFEQLFHNLRFAQRQDTNRFFVTKPPSVTALQIYRQQILQVLKMICPFYSVFAQLGTIIWSIYTGRLRIVFRSPTVDQMCIIFIGLMLAVLTIMIFSLAIQNGWKTQLKMLLHFTIVVMVNDFVNPL